MSDGRSDRRGGGGHRRPVRRRRQAASSSPVDGVAPNSTICVIDLAGCGEAPRKGGPGITQPDLLVNQTDLAPHGGAEFGVMARDAVAMRGNRSAVVTQVTNDVGVQRIAEIVIAARHQACTLLSSSSSSTKSAR